MKKTKALRTFFSSPDHKSVFNFTSLGWPQVVAPNVAFIQPSSLRKYFQSLSFCSSVSSGPSWKKLAVVRGADKKEEEKEKYSIEIWDSGQLVSSIPTDGKHAQIYSDGSPV